MSEKGGGSSEGGGTIGRASPIFVPSVRQRPKRENVREADAKKTSESICTEYGYLFCKLVVEDGGACSLTQREEEDLAHPSKPLRINMSDLSTARFGDAWDLH